MDGLGITPTIFHSLFNTIPMVATIINSQGKVVAVNSAAKKLIGEIGGSSRFKYKFGGEIFRCIHRHDHVNGCTFGPLCNDCDLRKYVFETLKGHTVIRSEAKLTVERKTKSKTVDLLISTGLIEGATEKYAIIIYDDNTQKRALEEEIYKSQKIESLGMLAGGIAHDFNNYLAVMMANVQLAGLRMNQGVDVGYLLKNVEDVIMRATGLTQQLRAFSKGGEPVKQIVSLKEIITETAMLVVSGKKVSCKLNIPNDLWRAEVDSDQITQVLTNLIINASQAMPEGVITIDCTNTTLKSPGRLPLQPGDYVKISVKDQGCGIPKENLSKVFDPFFTTKTEGSGLGLTVCYVVIRNHGGHIGVESSTGKGTTFYFYLPGIKYLQSVDLTQSAQNDYNPSGRGRILLMDDETDILIPLGEMLRESGFEVEFAREGAETIWKYQKAQADGRPFDTVVLDLIVPGGMGGQQTIEQLAKIDPDVKAVVSSGYSDNPVLANPRSFHFQKVITKPYRIEELKRILEELIG